MGPVFIVASILIFAVCVNISPLTTLLEYVIHNATDQGGRVIQTIVDIFENKDQILARLMEGRGEDLMPAFSAARMGDPVIVEDSIVLDLLRMYYLFGTHFAPGMLPCAPVAIGDVIDHDGNYYASISSGVLQCNAAMAHFSRPLEHLLVRWSEIHKDMRERVGKLSEHPTLVSLPGGSELIEACVEWDSTYAGWKYVGAPKLSFLAALRNVAELNLANREGHQDLISEILELVETLSPFVDMPEKQYALRQLLRHKGVAYAHDGRLVLSSPTASGGASTLFSDAGDDLMAAIPNYSLLLMIGCQAGNTGMMHFGGGSTTGIAIQLLPPAETILDPIQKAVDSDPELRRIWDGLTLEAEDLSAAAKMGMDWNTHLLPVIAPVVATALPNLLTQRALGFRVDLTSGDAVLSPVITESHAELHADALEEVKTSRQEYDAAVIDGGGEFGFASSTWNHILDNYTEIETA